MSVTLMDVLTATAEILQLDEVSDMLAHYGESVADESGETKFDLRADTDPDAKLLTAAAKTAVYEINGDGFPFIKTAEAQAENGEISFRSLGDGDAVYVVSVEKDGSFVGFASLPNGIAVGADGSYTVKYCAKVGNDLGYDSEINLGAQIGLYEIAYRAARNYCLMSSRPDEASVWDQRYIEQTEKLRFRRRAFLPRRRWV